MSEIVVRRFREKHPVNPRREPMMTSPVGSLDEELAACAICGYWGAVDATAAVLDALCPGSDSMLVCETCESEVDLA